MDKLSESVKALKPFYYKDALVEIWKINHYGRKNIAISVNANQLSASPKSTKEAIKIAKKYINMMSIRGQRTKDGKFKIFFR